MQLSSPTNLKESHSFVIRRSKRRKRTISISIARDRSVVISAPFHVSQKEIENFAIRKTNWVLDRLQKTPEQSHFKAFTDYIQSGYLPYLGNTYSIQIQKSALLKKRGFCFLENNQLIVQIPETKSEEQDIKLSEAAVRFWYHNEAKNLFKQRADLFSALIGVQYSQIKVGEHKSQWGSCNKKRIICINLRILMAPLELIDYLIVHELCHILHMNHSARYWHEVEKILPDYMQRRKALREFEKGNPLV